MGDSVEDIICLYKSIYRGILAKDGQIYEMMDKGLLIITRDKLNLKWSSI